MSFFHRKQHCHPHLHADGEIHCHPHSESEQHHGAGTLPTVALVGNPNTGKTTLFNSLTGLRQHVGNYPGVTVSKFSGTLPLVHGQRAELVDLPGIYSLAATSLDERVVIDVLAGHMAKDGTPVPDVIVCVADVNNLQRNLFLATQVAELGIPMVLVLNQIDVAHRDGLSVNTDLLRERFGIPVIACSARKGIGVDSVRQAISDALRDGATMHTIEWNAGTRKAFQTLRDGLSPENNDKISDAELQRVIFDVGSSVANRLLGEDVEKAGELVKKARACIRDAGENPHSTEALQRYAFLKTMLAGTTRHGKARTTATSVLDKILLHRVFGIILFAAAMFGVFWCIYTLAAFPMEWIEGAFGALGEWAGSKLEGMEVLQSLVVDGLIGGVGGVLVFLPQILILFLFLGVLESTGYMARAAFLMDKLFGWCGLNGKSFVPLLSGYACSIPGIMGARTIEDPRARLATILAVPFMSCGARMPVYSLMCTAFVLPHWGAFWTAVVFCSMYFIGLLIAVPVTWIYTHLILRSKPAPFVLELPRYQAPRFRDVGLRVWQSGVAYVKRAGTIIFAMSVVIWALSYFPRSEEIAEAARTEFVAANPQAAEEEIEFAVDAAFMENSYIGRFGKAIQPVFDPAGFDWRITVGVLGAFPARELIISTLGIIYSLGSDVGEDDEGLFAAMRDSVREDGTPVFTMPVVLAILVFFALCAQCLATLAVIARETSWKWAFVSWAQMTVLAWVAAVLVYQIGILF